MLEEEEYVAEMRRIIRRDYFPNAPQDTVAALDLSLDTRVRRAGARLQDQRRCDDGTSLPPNATHKEV